ncbi:hypothetical protein GCM10020331_031790 [Ectobacillus funiculus]
MKCQARRFLTKGLVERIGLNDSVFTITVNDEKQTDILDIPNHAVAVKKMLLEKLTSTGIIQSLDEIGGIGHRVVHGGEKKFNDSILLTEEILQEIEELNDLAPLHNPANIVGIRAFQEVLPNVPAVAVFDTAFHQTMPEESFFYTVYRMIIIKKSTASVSMAFTVHPINMLQNALQQCLIVQ